MNIWIFLFFFAIAAGLVVLFVVGTSCGVSLQITNEDACDPYAPKEKKNSLFELQEGLVFKMRHDFLEQSHVDTRMFNQPDPMAAHYFSQGDYGMAALCSDECRGLS